MIGQPVRWRFTSADGATLRLDMLLDTAWQLASGMDLGVNASENMYIQQPPYDGVTFVGARRGLVRMSFGLYLMPQASFAALQTLWNALIVELERDTNTIAYRPQGASADYLIDTYQADVPSFRMGDEGQSPFAHINDIMGPIPISMDRVPQMRGAGTFL